MSVCYKEIQDANYHIVILRWSWYARKHRYWSDQVFIECYDLLCLCLFLIVNLLLTCSCRGVFLLLCQDVPGEGHTVGVHGFPGHPDHRAWYKPPNLTTKPLQSPLQTADCRMHFLRRLPLCPWLWLWPTVKPVLFFLSSCSCRRLILPCVCLHQN